MLYPSFLERVQFSAEHISGSQLTAIAPPELVIMLHRLKRHPIPITAWFEHSLVLTYALPPRALQPLLPPGLELDCWRGYGFVAIAMVQTANLRPAGFPEWMGQNFFLTGYRIFTRFMTSSGRKLRGLRILRSDTDHRLMATFGNLLTHYNYRLAAVRSVETPQQFEVEISTPDGEGDLCVSADLSGNGTPLPEGSPFHDEREARLFAGPLPFTFDHEPETESMIVIEGVRREWKPRLVCVNVSRNSFLDQFAEHRPILASAFYVSGIPYLWKRGIREPLNRS